MGWDWGGNYYLLLISTSLVCKTGSNHCEGLPAYLFIGSFHFILSITPTLPTRPLSLDMQKKNFLKGTSLACVRSLGSLFYDTVKHINRKKILADVHCVK